MLIARCAFRSLNLYILHSRNNSRIRVGRGLQEAVCDSGCLAEASPQWRQCGSHEGLRVSSHLCLPATHYHYWGIGCWTVARAPGLTATISCATHSHQHTHCRRSGLSSWMGVSAWCVGLDCYERMYGGGGGGDNVHACMIEFAESL